MVNKPLLNVNIDIVLPNMEKVILKPKNEMLYCIEYN